MRLQGLLPTLRVLSRRIKRLLFNFNDQVVRRFGSEKVTEGFALSNRRSIGDALNQRSQRGVISKRARNPVVSYLRMTPSPDLEVHVRTEVFVCGQRLVLGV